MYPEIDAIIAADQTARRDVEGLRARLTKRLEEERARMARQRAEADAAALARLDESVAELAREGRTRLAARLAQRAAVRKNREDRAAVAKREAVTAYVEIVMGAARRAGQTP